MDDGSLKQEVYRGERMAEIVADPLVVEVFNRLTQEAIQEWRDCETSSKASDSDAWHRLRALDSLRAELQSVVNTGRMAAQQLGVKRGQS